MTRRLPASLPILAGILAVYLIAPFIAGVQQVAFADWRSVDVAALLRACAVSIGSASAATALLAIGGIPLGYLLARIPGRGMAAVGFLVQLPLALPPLASGILLLFLVGYGSPLGRFAQGMLTSVPLFADHLARKATGAEIHGLLQRHFEGARFIEVAPLAAIGSAADIQPEVLNNTNRMRLHVFANDARGQVLLMAIYDNLGKGASGAAVQNLNLMIGADEAAAVDLAA